MELFWQEALLALPDQLAPLLGSGALSGAAPAEARVGVDICSDDGRPAPPHTSVSPAPVTLRSRPTGSPPSNALGPEFGA